MRKVLLFAFLLAASSYAFSQERDSVIRDTSRSGSERGVGVELSFPKRKQDTKGDTVITSISKRRFSIGLTIARIDLGFSRYLDQGSFTLSPENNFLSFKNWKTHNVGFEFFQMGVRFNSNFKVYLGAGLDWNHIRLERNITFLKDQPSLTYRTDSVNYKKNRFSSQYLRIPLSFQYRTRDDDRGKNFYFVAGPEVGFLLGGKQKQVSDEFGKVKTKDDFNFNPFRYGGFVRFGYGNVGVYTKYYFNDVFADNQGPGDFRNMSFGLTVGF